MATDTVAAVQVADVRLDQRRAHVLNSAAGQWLCDNGWYGVQASRDAEDAGSTPSATGSDHPSEITKLGRGGARSPGRKRQRRQQAAGCSWELTLEETVYQHALGGVRVLTGDTELDANQLWAACCSEQEHFPATYAVYRHWRRLGWIPRPGLQYGVTYLLYRGDVQARQHQHAE